MQVSAQAKKLVATVAATIVLGLVMLALLMAPPSVGTPNFEGDKSSLFSLSTAQADPNPAGRCDALARQFKFGSYRYTSSEPATGRKYRGGTSFVRHYRAGECHFILRNSVILHGPHIRHSNDDS